MSEPKPKPSSKDTSKTVRDVAIVVSCWAGVTAAAILQFTIVLGVQITPRSLVVPMAVGITFGFVVRRIVRFREEERELRRVLEERESELALLNRDLEAKVEERTAALRQKEAELIQSQKMEAIGRLAGGVAHDFNNLLTTIVGGASLLEETLSPYDEEPLELVQEIQLASERATRLTRQLLTMSRKQVLRREPLAMAKVVDGLLPILRRLIAEDIELKADIDFECPPVFADRAQMEQLVLNLCVNARDAMPRGGSLSIGIRKAAATEAGDIESAEPLGYCVLEVRDNGAGMNEETKARIFEPFFTTKDVGKGTGLGLSVVHGIIESADGAVVVESAEGEGTAFKVFLPLTDRAVSQEEKSPQRPVKAPERTTILVVEDEAAVRRFVKQVLTSRGYTVLEASSSTEAISTAQSHSGEIALVLSDVVMPGMSGPEAAAEISRFRPNARVMFMTGYPGDEISERVGENVSATTLQKPFDAKTLSRAVAKVLEQPTPANANLAPGSAAIN